MQHEQLYFLKNEQQALLKHLDGDTSAKWGVMTAQQMVEHVRDFFNISIEKIPVNLLTPEEHLPKYKEFLYSDKPFKENTKAPTQLLGDTPLPIRYPTLDIAKEKLEQTIQNFFTYFEQQEGKTSVHPVFGTLNYEEWVRLHYKHVTHHFRQFGLTE